MGQYYCAVNLTKKEYVHPHRIGGLAKLWEWATNPFQAGCLVLLLGWSTGSGGGDPDWNDPDISAVAGRWAGDRVALVGDYHNPDGFERDRDNPTFGVPDVPVFYSDLLDSKDWTDISALVCVAWDKFVDVDGMRCGDVHGMMPDMIVRPVHGGGRFATEE